MPPANRKKKEDNKPQHGAYMFPNGDKYEGEFVHGTGEVLERSGTGTHTAKDGTVYTGQWASDRLNGTGKIRFDNGAKYEGPFVNNMFHGKGRYTWPNGSSYQGDFVENKLQGEGEFTDPDGQVWTGKFMSKAAPCLKFRLVM